MPELPEVETIKLGLEKHVIGHTITAVDVFFPRILSGDTDALVGAQIVAIRRFGKGLVIDLDNGYSMAVHVKMTGRLIYAKGGDDFPKHTHVIFQLDGNAVLYFNDIRRFGWLKVVKTEDVSDMPFFRSLGPEPLRDLSLDKFKLILKKNKTPIKSLLMDQAKIAGIGNIYANDALYFAKIHPHRSSSSLQEAEAALLFTAIEEILQKSITVGGASANNYVNALGEKGTYQNQFLVYQKDGQACIYCSEPIKRIKTAGRSTFFCETCQQ